MEDFIAFSKSLWSRHAIMRRRYRWNLLSTPLIFLCACGCVALMNRTPDAFVAGVIFAFVFILSSLPGWRTMHRRIPAGLNSDAPRKDFHFPHTASVSPDGYFDRTEDSEHFYKWHALHDIAFTPDHIFLYTTVATAHIIPKRELSDALFLEVSDAIRQ